jgi:uncharacterized membrane protein
MSEFSLALLGFVLLHVGVSATGLRAVLVKTIGEGPFRGAFALASIALLAALIWTYAATRDAFDNPQLFASPAWGRHVTHALMLCSLLLVVPGFLTPGPTQAGFEGALNKPDPVKGIHRVTRHPFLWGAILWGVAHLFSNGDRASVSLFGALALMVLVGVRSIDRKGAARNPEGWARYAAQTSNIPFAAILQGRNRLVLSEMWWRLLLALGVFAALGYFHRLLFGVPAFVFGA